MKSLVFATALVAMLLGATVGVPTQTNPHAYFDALVTRADHWKSFSLRPVAGAPISSPHYGKQLSPPKDGGYAVSNSAGLWITYNPAGDTDPFRQDAARVVIPAFSNVTTTSTAINATQTLIPLTVASSSLWSNGRALKIDGEIMTVVRVSGVALSDNNVPVVRGQYGTAAASHAAGAAVAASQNSLANQVRLPLGTSDGKTYLFTWDVYYTSSYLRSGLTNHKAYQFTSGDTGDQWLEPQTRFDGGGGLGQCSGWNPNSHVASIEARGYNQNLDGDPNWSLTSGNDFGPGTTSKEPIGPKAGSFCMAPNKWTRIWVRVEQRASDYDYVDMWVADEDRAPVQIYRRIPLSVRPTGAAANSIPNFWLEFNTSTTGFVRGDLRDLVAYLRNFAALVNPPSDVSSLLLRPLAGVPPPTSTLSPPTRLRIIGG